MTEYGGQEKGVREKAQGKGGKSNSVEIQMQNSSHWSLEGNILETTWDLESTKLHLSSRFPLTCVILDMSCKLFQP